MEAKINVFEIKHIRISDGSIFYRATARHRVTFSSRINAGTMVCSDISFTVVPSRGNVFIVYSNAKYDGEYDVSLVARLKLAHVYDTYTIIIFDVNTERKYFDLKRYSALQSFSPPLSLLADRFSSNGVTQFRGEEFRFIEKFRNYSRVRMHI